MAKEPNSKPIEYSCYYADLQVTVKVIPEAEHPLDGLTLNEQHVLSQIIYLALNNFHYTRALYKADDY